MNGDSLIDEETKAALSAWARLQLEQAAIDGVRQFVQYVSLSGLLDMLEALRLDFGEEAAA